ncbi:MAG: vitamin K epoxide reductase family protein [Jatrophihabitans sp.]
MTLDQQRRLLPNGARAVALVSAVAALAVSVYLTVEHYSRSIGFACPESATINCVKVTTSKYSVIAGVPVALLGLLFFVGMTVLLALPVRNRFRDLAVLAGSGVGVLMVLWLVYVELFEVDAICLWCTGVHVLTIIMFGAVLWSFLPSLDDDRPVR